TAYTPQQNGVSERKNKTLMNMVRSMLAGKCVPKRFWPEVVVWATYVINRSPTLSVKDITPEEAWSDLKPSVSYFKVFGCLAYVHVPDAQRKKLDPKSINDMDTTSDNTDLEDTNSTEDNTILGPRTRKPPAWVRDFVTDIEQHDEEQLQNLVVFCNNEDPTCYEEAVKLAVWRQAMDQEIESIESNKTWELVDLP
ncbi:retrovirus-related pol polyprotein from transposon tnt 1-94, partial [Trifolium medium]|nr:retrovirus-related pol polyprotein from transposon tnt 1-94 [Trifolium medium]